jgi:hypothetical protein
LLPRGQRRRTSAIGADGRLDDEPAEQVFATRIHEVERHGHQRDEQQVALLSNQREASHLVERPRAFGNVFRLLSAGVAPLDERGDDHARHQDAGGDQHQGKRTRRAHDIAGVHGSQPGAETAAEADNGEKPFPLLGRVEIVHERPELGDDHDVEDADPEEVRHGDAQAEPVGDDEQQDVRGEEQRDPANQLNAVDPRGEGAERRHQADQQDRLAGGGVRLHGGPPSVRMSDSRTVLSM